VSKKPHQPRRCPLCAEVVKQDAVKCRFCGSSLAGKDLGLVDGKGKDAAVAIDAWPTPGPDDVGLPGLAALVGALVTYGAAVWFLPTALLVALVLAGAGAGAMLGRTVTRR
jgi:hypothetical protein